VGTALPRECDEAGIAATTEGTRESRLFNKAICFTFRLSEHDSRRVCRITYTPSNGIAARRSRGSLLKPFIYVRAIDEGIEYRAPFGRDIELELRANVDGEARRVYWYADGQLIGESEPGRSLFWQPQAGTTTIRGLDSFECARRSAGVASAKDGTAGELVGVLEIQQRVQEAAAADINLRGLDQALAGIAVSSAEMVVVPARCRKSPGRPGASTWRGGRRVPFTGPSISILVAEDRRSAA